MSGDHEVAGGRLPNQKSPGVALGRSQRMRVKTISVVTMLMLVVQAIGAQGVVGRVARVSSKTIRTVDPATGIEVRVVQSAKGDASIELSTGDVTIRKQMNRGRSTVTMTTSGDTFTLAIAPDAIEVSGGGQVWRSSPSEKMTVDRLATVLTHSNAAVAGRSLLARLTLDPASAIGNALLLTRAMLEIPSQAHPSVDVHQKWAHSTAIAPGAVCASLPDEEGPSDPSYCWTTYARYAIQIYDEFLDCKRDLHWYDFIGAYSCDIIYIIEAELAFSWLLNCAGPLPWKQ